MMIQPTVQSIPAFDAKNSALFTFDVVGGNQVVSNRLVIRNNNTGEIIYNQKIESYKFEHILPPNTLINGIYYNFYFQTYDAQGNESPRSETILFICYETPTIQITNIPVDGIIHSNNFSINIQYNQTEGELLDVSQVILFDGLDNEIFKSENIYNISEAVPVVFTYNLKGLDYDKTYAVQIVSNTVNKTIIKSSKYTFTVRYFTPQITTLFELKNNCTEGCVELKNNFIVVDTKQNPEDLTYNPKYLHDGKLDLRENDSYLSYVSGFNIANDFTARFLVENVKIGHLITFSNYEHTIEINLVNINGEYYLELKAFEFEDGDNAYMLYSNQIYSLSQIFIWVKKKDGLFEIKATNDRIIDKKSIVWNSNKTDIYYDSNTDIYWR